MNINSFLRRAAGWMVLLLGSVNAMGDTETNADEIVARSFVSGGNLARLDHVFDRARHGETITVAVIGGSVTQGARASTPEKRYANLVADWWQQTFPQAKIKLVNAGIGATGSDYGALRANRDLLAHKPDFVIVEFAVNDFGAPQGGAESLEGLVRQILNQPQQPAVLMFLLIDEKGLSTGEWHAKVAAHYELPVVSFSQALWPEVQQGRLKWRDIEVDDVHPNDRGHLFMAQFVNHALDRLLKSAAEPLPPVPPMPAPLFSDQFEHVAFFAGDHMKPASNSGWLYETNSHALVATEPGSTVEFELEGQTILAAIWREHRAFGKVRLQVDDGPPVVQDAWYDQTWGGYREIRIVARDLKPGKHRLKAEVLADKNPNSTGHEVRLIAIGCAGLSTNTPAMLR